MTKLGRTCGINYVNKKKKPINEENTNVQRRIFFPGEHVSRKDERRQGRAERRNDTDGSSAHLK